MLRADCFHLDVEITIMILQSFLIITQAVINEPHVATSSNHVQVIRAEDFQPDIEALLVHGQGFLWLTLTIEHIADAA